jgi:hypothetical protein
MAVMESPYQPPAEFEENCPAQYRPKYTSAFAMVGFVVFPLFGGFIGFAGTIAAALLLETGDEWSGPRLSYGQQAGLISLPICTIIGAAIGLGVSLAFAGRYLVAIVLLILMWLSSWRIMNSMWSDQILRYGRDPSEAVLYFPPIAFSFLALLVALIIGSVAGAQRRAKSRDNGSQPGRK